jgi:hypothetical protein
MGEEEVYAEVGRRGLLIPLAAFRARVGGEGPLRRILSALSVAEKVHAGRPRGMARTVRHAYIVDRDRAGGRVAETLCIPRLKGPPFLRARTRGGRPLLDGIREAPAGGTNAPLPLPREVPEARRAAEEPLYEYQEAAVDFLCGEDGPLGPRRVAEHQGVAYLQMDTGLGKSRVGLAVIARRGEPGLVVAPTDAIAQQWVDEAREIYPGLVAEIYRNPPKGSRRRPPGPVTHDLVVVIVNTFRDKTPDFMEGFGTVVLDEAHEYHSTHNCRALWLAQARAVLGLSATPVERPDGLDRYVLLHLGPFLTPADIPGFDAQAVSFRGEVRLVEYAGHPDHCETATTPAGTMSAILTTGNIIKDPHRMRLVAAEVERLCHLHETASPEECARLGLGPRPPEAATATHPVGEVRRHGVFVFAEHRAFLPALREALLERFEPNEVLAPELGPAPAPALAPAWAVSILRGGASRGAVGRARAAGAHVVLTTYGFSRRGVNLPDMTAIVEATSRRNGTRQILGRMLRRGSDESIVRQVVDIVDVRTGLRGQVADRRKIYREKGYPISKIAVSWEDYAAPGAPAGPGGPDSPDPEGDAPLADLPLDALMELALGVEGALPAGDGPEEPLDVDAILGIREPPAGE